jgi:molybdate transport system ATP-binding protein
LAGEAVSLSVELRKQFAGKRSFELDVRFQADAGVTVLFGPSGSGKSTLLECIAGLSLPDAGMVRLHDRELLGVPIEHRRIGYLFQTLALFPHMTAQKNVEFGLAARSAAERRRVATEMLERLHVADLAEQRADQISGGERQRVALARTLVIEPQALLLDEPLSALDLKTKAAIMADLRAWNERRRIPILYVTHALEEALSLGDRVIILKEGRIAAEGEPRIVLTAERELLMKMMTAPAP